VTVSCASRRTLDCAEGFHGRSFISQNSLSEWQNEYQAALLELDRKKLLERVTAAETAIFNSIQAFRQVMLRNARPSKMRWQTCAL
jgi:hypothetical protein